MATATNLVLKVSADTKDATKQLKTVGVNVEDVATKTKKASNAMSVWDESIKKASKDNIKNLVNMGAKILTISSAVNLVSKGIKSCFDEALKRDSEAGKKLDEISSVWTNIKADLGSGLLDSISPALDALYEQLQKISKWISDRTSGKSVYDMVKEDNTKDLSSYSADILGEAFKLAFNEADAKSGLTNLIQTAYQAALARESLGYTASGAKTYDLNSFDGTKGAGTASHQESIEIAMRGRLRQYYKPVTSTGYTFGDSSYVSYMERQNRMKTDISDIPSLNLDADGFDTQWSKVAVKVKKVEKEIEVGVSGTAKSTSQLLQESLQEWSSYFSTISSYASQTFSSIGSLIDQLYQNQIDAIEASGNSEEEIANETAELKEQQFNANKANSIAQATIDTASAIMNIWATNGGVPAVAGVLTALASATGAAQIATIASQKYTGLAVGGIVSSPTLTKLGEGGEKEAVLPLSKLKDFVQESTPTGSISITVNVADGTRSSNVAEDVYYAIERAQRTGLLPKWKYA